MIFDSTEIGLAAELDAQDELAAFRDRFFIHDPDTIYLDGNSLGRLPRRTIAVMKETIEREWGERLIRSWGEGWMDLPKRLGAKIASLVGAHEDEVVVTDATSVNLFKLAMAGLEAQPDRGDVVSDELNFPSDLYILQGMIRLLGNRHRLVLAASEDGITVPLHAFSGLLNDQVALLYLTQVAFKSGSVHDMAALTKMAHEAGALTLWDLSHSVGVMPLKLNEWDVDMAVGCTYKYLNGGPGAPAFVYVRRDLQHRLNNPIWGWLACEDPFAFNLDFRSAPDVLRFKVGTPPILSMRALEPALDILLEAGIERVRAKSSKLTEYLIYLADRWLVPLGFTLGTPRQAEMRGSHVSLCHPQAEHICRALIEAPPPQARVIPDFRTPDNIRLGVAPLYTSFTEIHRALHRMRAVVAS